MLKLFQQKQNTHQARILVVDDEPGMVDILKFRLESYKYEVITAVDGNEGLAKALDEKPDLVLLDIGMPGMNGFKMLAHLREHPDLKEVPVIMVTSHFEPHEIADALSYGAVDYVIKPYQHKDLMNRIADALQKKSN